MDPSDLVGKHVFITGASGGIGMETAKLFLEIGCNVTLHYNSNSEPVEALIKEIEEEEQQWNKNNDKSSESNSCSNNNSSSSSSSSKRKWKGKARGVKAECKSEDDVIASFATNPFGPYNVLILNHAIYYSNSAPLHEMSLDQWRATMSVNLDGSFLFAREYLKQLHNVAPTDPAAIIIIGSTAGKYGEACHADYAASKSALMGGLMLSLKNEIVKIHPKGRVNAIAPGWVRTPMADVAMQNPDILYQAMASTPLKKIAEPVEVARSCVFLASSKLSGHISGLVLDINGGMEGRLLNSRDDIIKT